MWSHFRLPATAVVIVGAAPVLYGLFTVLQDRALYHPDGVVLLVRNQALPEEVGKQVLNGIHNAMRKKPGQLRQVSFNIPPGAETPENLAELEDQLTQQIARQSVLGVISDGSSQTDGVVIKVCRTLRIPLLLTSATDDDLLQEDDGFIFRLPAANSKQAEDMGKKVKSWCQEGLQNVAILYETNAYGEGLHRRLNSVGETGAGDGGCEAVHVRVQPQGEMAPLVPRLNTLQVNTIVFLGYYLNAYDLIVALKSERWEGRRLLLADSAFSDAVEEAARKLVDIDTWIAYPVEIRPARGSDPELYQFGAFGHDAWLLLDRLRQEKTADAAKIRELLQAPPESLVRREGYEFNPRGENLNSKFPVLPLTEERPCESL